MHRRVDDEGGDHLDEAAADQQKDVEEQQDQLGVARDTENVLRERLGELRSRQHPPQDHGGRRDEHHGGGLHPRSPASVRHTSANVSLSIHAHAEHDRVEHRDDGRFGRGKDCRRASRR